MPEVKAYGSWPSPIDAALVARSDGRPGWVSVAAGSTWWVAPRPEEAGRVTLLRTGRVPDGTAEVVVPAPWSVRSRVHEYGGRAYVVVESSDGGADVVFSEYSDQRLYRLRVGADDAPRPLTPQPALPSGLRYIEPFLGPGGDDVWCIREEHIGPAPTDVTRAIVAVPLDGSAASDPERVRVVVRDTHFLACPRVSPDGRRLSWIGWEHPLMPWDETRLRVADLDGSGAAGEPMTVAGGADESIVQAEWADDDTLLFVGDATGWWNLHRITVGGGAASRVNLTPRDEEFGTALWQLGAQWFAQLPGGDIAVIHGTASTSLGILSGTSGELTDVPAPGLSEWAATLAVDPSTPDGPTVIGVAAGPHRHGEVVSVTVASVAGGATTEGVSRLSSGDAANDSAHEDTAYLPEPQARTFRAADGREVHASLYPPRHPSVVGPDNELPPYLVYVHGGPTSRALMVHDLEIAYFTSRGIGVVEVNYGGSTGFGREYRNRLRENWGVVDVDDSVAVAQALVDEGLADPSRLAIRGGSAGGWTSAAALTFTDVFDAATIMYPIIDLAGWRNGETHDFESQYLESLVGPWPQTAERYRERSPVNFPERVNAPFLMLQGLEDEICPPTQAERFVEIVAERGVPHAYLTFEGEQHGFRRAETIIAAMEAELSLYAQVFGFEPAGVSQPLVVTGLAESAEARR